MLTGAPPTPVPAGSPLGAAQRMPAPAPADVWQLRVGDLDESVLDTRALDGAERRRAAALQRPAERLGYLSAHLLLRELLGQRLGCAPGDLDFSQAPCPHCGEPHGRPQLTLTPLPVHFSLSRSGGVILVALAPAPVGVDVEALADRQTALSVAATLHHSERAEVLSAPAHAQPAVFTRLWARKEAYLKGVGTGIAVDLAAEHPLERAAAGWAVHDLPAPAGYAAALAVRRNG